jgi:hypothetical protein
VTGRLSVIHPRLYAVDSTLPASCDQLWAIVAYAHSGAGRRLLWSPAHRAWLRSRDFGPGFLSTPVPGDDGRPYDDELAAIPALATELIRSGICQRCGLSDLGDHFIAPDVYGMSAIYCVQMPDRSIVESFGGSGTRKHWGSLNGCSAVKAGFYTDSWEEEHVSFGEGLVASHVRDWSWCNRCTGSAANITSAANAKGISPAAYVQAREDELLRTRKANRARRHCR